MSEQSLSEKIAALPAEERAARYLQVVREQGLSMATQKRCQDETIASLRQRVADLTRALEGMLDEWDRLTRYGSPMAKAANPRVAAARAALASSDSK